MANRKPLVNVEGILTELSPSDTLAFGVPNWETGVNYVLRQLIANGTVTPKLLYRATAAYTSGVSIAADVTAGKLEAVGGSGTGGGGLSQIDHTTASGVYGHLSGDVNGINPTFIVSEGFYVSGHLTVSLDGQIMDVGIDWVETDPATGIFDMVIPPASTSSLRAEYGGTNGGVYVSDTFLTTLDFGRGGQIASASVSFNGMTNTKIIQVFYTTNLDEVAVLNMRVVEQSRTAGVGFSIVGVAPDGAFGQYSVRCVVSGS